MTREQIEAQAVERYPTPYPGKVFTNSQAWLNKLAVLQREAYTEGAMSRQEGIDRLIERYEELGSEKKEHARQFGPVLTRDSLDDTLDEIAYLGRIIADLKAL